MEEEQTTVIATVMANELATTLVLSLKDPNMCLSDASWQKLAVCQIGFLGESTNAVGYGAVSGCLDGSECLKGALEWTTREGYCPLHCTVCCDHLDVAGCVQE